MTAKNIFIQTYGCTSNKADSQTMIGLLKQAGYEITDNENDADYLLVNSCAVKSATEEKIIYRLKELSKSNKKIIIAGCLTKVNPERIRKTMPNFAAMLDPRSVHRVVDVVKQVANGNQNIVQISEIPAEKPELPRFSFSKVIDIIKLSEGCLSNCSFCATKLARGNLYSYRPDIIRDAVKQGLREGYKEFHLTSEDSSAYGRDIGTNLAELLESVSGIEGKFWVRIGMMNPLHFLHTSTRNAFKSVNVSPFAKVLYPTNKIEYLRNDFSKRSAGRIKVDAEFNPNVALIYTYPGIKPEFVRSLNNYDGIVIAVSGLGQVPTGSHGDKFAKSLIPTIKSLIDSGIPIAVAPQTIYGRLDLNVYDAGRMLNETGAIGDGCDWLPETALVKLMWVLGHTKNMSKIREMMLTDYVGEISERTEVIG